MPSVRVITSPRSASGEESVSVRSRGRESDAARGALTATVAQICVSFLMYTREAENAELSGFTVADPVRYNRDYASNNSYVGQLTNGVSFTYTVNASEATTAHLFAGLSKRTYDKEFSSMFSVSVNGKTIFVPTRYLPAISGSEEDWHCFYSLLLTTIELNEGENTIVFTTVTGDTANFDYIKLYSTVELS